MEPCRYLVLLRLMVLFILHMIKPYEEVALQFICSSNGVLNGYISALIVFKI